MEDHKSERSGGSTLSDALLVVAIVGVILAVAAPRIRRATLSTPQQRTMSNLRALGAALHAYRVDYNGFPSGTITTTLSYLDPNYMVDPPVKDGWRSVFNYTTARLQGSFAQEYTITSYGRNLASDGYKTELTSYFNCDIIYVDGQFVQRPGGEQWP